MLRLISPRCRSALLLPTRSLTVGDSVSERRVFTKEEVADFARISGDTNPLHLDESYAATTRFGRCIVHGILVVGIFSKLMGTKMPGTGTIYVQQTAKFTAPCFIGEEVEARIRLKELTGRRAVFETQCFSTERNEMIIDGEAITLVSKSVLEKK